MLNKLYARLDHFKLPVPPVAKGELRSLLVNRKSFRDFSGVPISAADLSDILFHSGGIVRLNPKDPENPFRAYPSAGAKYPLEMYPLILTGTDPNPGLYHYDAASNVLDILLSPVLSEELESIWMKQPWFKKSSVIIFFTAVYRRTTEKYGQQGLSFPYIEAGHIVQNIYLMAELLNIGCCAIGQLQESALIRLLDVNSDDEFPVYYVALGS